MPVGTADAALPGKNMLLGAFWDGLLCDTENLLGLRQSGSPLHVQWAAGTASSARQGVPRRHLQWKLNLSLPWVINGSSLTGHHFFKITHSWCYFYSRDLSDTSDLYDRLPCVLTFAKPWHFSLTFSSCRWCVFQAFYYLFITYIFFVKMSQIL